MVQPDLMTKLRIFFSDILSFFNVLCSNLVRLLVHQSQTSQVILHRLRPRESFDKARFVEIGIFNTQFICLRNYINRKSSKSKKLSPLLLYQF